MKIKAYYNRYSYNVLIAVEAIFANKVKSLLTALGIIFGVAAVISMLAIGNGAEQEILEQIKMVGVNNIIVTPILQADQASSNDTKSNAATKGQLSVRCASVSAHSPAVNKPDQPTPKVICAMSKKAQLLRTSVGSVICANSQL